MRYYGQYVALAVADTFEQAMAAADAVKVDVPRAASRTWIRAPERRRRAEGRRASAATPEQGVRRRPTIKVDQTYGLPPETHNPIELHATVALWDGSTFTLYETTQGVVNHRNVLAQMLGVPKENVRVISKFLGSGFGGKLWPWTHVGARRGRRAGSSASR